MIRQIMRSEKFLAEPSEPAGEDDLPVARDLLDTLAAHEGACVGMAANMIGVRKRIIVFADGRKLRAMLNPEIVSAAAPYDTEEGCLSLRGMRPAKRYRRIKVRYLDLDMRSRTETFKDYTAQIIQHEIDHCNGVII